MDELEKKLASILMDIPGGTYAYGRRVPADEAAKVIREMIEKAVASGSPRYAASGR